MIQTQKHALKIYVMDCTNSLARISVRMDADIKEQLDNFCNAVGMNTNTAINMFARRVVRDKKLPFEVTLIGEPLTGEAWLTEPDLNVFALCSKNLQHTRRL